jgi:hypothetical protein
MLGLTFGTFVPHGWRMDLVDIRDAVEKYETMSRCAREAEKAGYDALWLYDHFHSVPTPQTEATFESWSSMAALARDTSSIKLGQIVTCNSYRPPALLAKVSICIDVLSHGRLIVGVGAGWYQTNTRPTTTTSATCPSVCACFVMRSRPVRGVHRTAGTRRCGHPGGVDLGFEYIIVDQPNMAEVGVIQGFAEQVIPLVRQAARVAG